MAASLATQAKRKHHCLDVWAIPNETFQLSDEERAKVIPSLVRSPDSGPFPPNSLHQPAPISLWEETIAILLLLVPMGGPIFWIIATTAALVFGDSITRLGAVLCFGVLAYHPMPSVSLLTSRCTQILYRYFTYRFVWTDDNFEKVQASAPWIGAGPPHGVLPFANILSIPAINTIAQVPFVGAPASVVFHTPFLRYFTLYPSTPVGSQSIAKSIAAGTSVGIVPDGIAGIFHQSAHREVVALKHRQGLARHALRHGTTLLPAYSFGNTAAFGAWWDPWGVLQWASRKAQASMFLYWGRFGLPIPKRVQITMVFGSPIPVARVPEPTEEQISALHQKLLAGIQDCFETHKSALGWGDKELVFE